MGRKPDVLIATYFDRGTKLQDASNRYSFTCRACNTLFPKGRTSHLIDHLVGNATRCPALTPGDIDDIMAIRASKSAEKMQRASAKRSAAYSFLEQDSLSTVQRKRQVTHGNGANRSLSGLEALAEASRRVEWPAKRQGNRPVDLERDIRIDPDLRPLAGVFEPEQTSASDLSSIAASASTLEESLPTSRDLSMPKEDTIPTGSQELSSETLSEQLNRAVNFPVLIAANPTPDLVQAMTDATTGKTSKSRSKFTQTRREEVRDVRSKRACIRCRMLRKPCSSEDPCARCSSIKNPRIWSSKCTRGRLADVCDLYTALICTQTIKSRVLKLQREQGITNRKDILGVLHGMDQTSMANFDLTVLHHTLEDGKTYPAPECFVPRDLGYKECELIRSMMTEVDVQTFPKEIQQSLAWGQKLTIDAEIQLFRHSSSLYHCTRFLVTPFSNIHLYLLSDPSITEPQSPNSTTKIHNLLTLAYKSIVEYVAQEDCHSLLKTMEQALVNRTLSNCAVFTSAIMLFSSLELLQHHLYTQQSILDSQTNPSNPSFPRWSLPDPPRTWAAKLDDFSSFMQDLLRCRHIISDLEIDARGALAVSPASQDVAMRDLFMELNIDSGLLSRHDAAFVLGSPHSLYFKHTARMLLSSQGKDLMRGEK